jgi:DNA-directed RNA polymerase subunit RPC12/RpoP
MTKEEPMSTPQHCPGYENFRNLKSFTCKCSECGKEAEIFSDEFDRPHMCKGCGKKMDFTQCELTGEAKTTAPR